MPTAPFSLTVPDSSLLSPPRNPQFSPLPASQLNEQGLNVSLYWKNPDPRKFVNVVPTSAITGEGIPDLLQLIVKLTQTMMGDRLMYVADTQCTGELLGRWRGEAGRIGWVVAAGWAGAMRVRMANGKWD